MELRNLKIKDAPFMLEWMHDADVVAYLGTNFREKSIDDCLKFIESSNDDMNDVHKAIVDKFDTYMGTVSLKHIDRYQKIAEFAITVRKIAMGKGYSKFGMVNIISTGFDRYGLNDIFWCVSRKNKRAIRFYEKNGYQKTVSVPDYIKNKYRKEQLDEFIWFHVKNNKEITC